MAAPNYTNDLITIATGDLNFDAGTWDESSDAGWDTAGAMVDDTNLQYATTSVNTGEAADSCTSAQYTKIGTGSGAAGPGTIMYQHTAAFTVPADGVILAHSLWAAPLALNPYAGTFGTAEAGVSFLIGDSFGVFDVHYVSGSDKAPAPEGGWATYAVDPTVTPDGSVGTPTTTTCVGIGIAATAQARGNPQAMQYVRYGRGEQEYTLGEIANPATFEGYAILDNAAADRFNLLKYLGNGYSARGLMTFGTAATAVYFEDSDKTLTIADDPKVGSSFNQGIVNNAGSIVNWTNISIINLSPVSKYKFTVNDSAETNQTGGVFEDLGVFIYGSNSTNTDVIYRRQELVTQGRGTFIRCTFDKSIATSALSSDNLSIVTKCNFKSDGTGHAVNLGPISSNQSMNWDNSDIGYTDASSGNETILVSVDSGVTLTINVSATASIPSIYNTGLGTVNVVAGLITLTITTQDNNEVRIRQGSHTIQHTQNVVGGQETYTYSYVAGTKVTISVGASGFIREELKNYELLNNNVSLSFILKPSSSYI